MIRFKNLKSGFSFVEIMIALALLGIFGSSLFLVQSNIFSKVFKTHQALFFYQDNVYNMVQLKNKIQQAILQKKSIEGITIEEDKKNPNRKINLTLAKISDQSELKSFSKNVRIVKNSITYDDNRTIQLCNLIYIPKVIEQTQKEEVKNPQGTMV